ncbi:hypothetical protein J6590_041120 [Homalodisca vitripennis]|nr:hypothetical protein J6590_041120 [Homalodisca vitripennis]
MKKLRVRTELMTCLGERWMNFGSEHEVDLDYVYGLCLDFTINNKTCYLQTILPTHEIELNNFTVALSQYYNDMNRIKTSLEERAFHLKKEIVKELKKFEAYAVLSSVFLSLFLFSSCNGQDYLRHVSLDIWVGIEPSPDRPFILCQNTYDQIDTRPLRPVRAGLGRAGRSWRVSIACIPTPPKGRAVGDVLKSGLEQETCTEAGTGHFRHFRSKLLSVFLDDCRPDLTNVAALPLSLNKPVNHLSTCPRPWLTFPMVYSFISE